MKFLKNYLQKKYGYSNYQIAQLEFFFKTIFSEASKMVIMGILFRNHFSEYLFALCVMLGLRCTTGGLHFYTYFGCLFTSIVYLALAIYIFPPFKLISYIQSLLLLVCFILCYLIGPITSKYRPPIPDKPYRRFRAITCGIIFAYAVLLYIIPQGPHLTVGFWVIILHTLQLTVAKLYRKEV